MNPRTLLVAAWVLSGCAVATPSAFAQASSGQLYTLVTGSQLIDDCPACGRPTILAPMTGTFVLNLTNQNSLFSTYEVLNVHFSAGTTSGPQYRVEGSGTYQFGGEVAVMQNMFLDVAVNNGFTTTRALCANSNRTVTVRWPKLQIDLDQTNGTITQVYHLAIVAVPATVVGSLTPDQVTGDIHLEWQGGGTNGFQVERASTPGGPYSAVSPITTNTSFTDPGVLTNAAQFFYRIRQY